jgi:hypothetical protein
MRLALVLVVAGCMQQTYSDPPPQPGGGWGTGPGGTGGSESFGCHADSACGINVCARDGECVPATEVRTVHVLWTVSGQPAGTMTCGNAPDLELTFLDSSDAFGFSPVPCVEGKFTVDKLPAWYESVQLSPTYDSATGASGEFGSDGNVQLDLVY